MQRINGDLGFQEICLTLDGLITALELKDLRINNENESRKKKFKESLVGDMSVDWIDGERQRDLRFSRKMLKL